ncbi:P-loop containing nucleoside triphosphate hydrolase protein [Xylariomycetidae sp. FL2044]|nr:P-loop containing nucleoside triphosphate hydrolase protein [Xylariomycetidae sp. FL2044]
MNYIRRDPAPYSQEYRHLLASRRQLVVSAAREEFLKLYQANNVVILTSDTGCGKITQVPQFVLYDEFHSSGVVACTQPRRLAATSVAKRVAEEMDVPLGQEVGYLIRGDHRADPRITRLVNSMMFRYSCIIVDEAHERSLHTDTVLCLLKKVLAKRKDLKLIVMSATMNSTKFSRYFGDAPVLHIPGRTFPVKMYHLKGASPSYTNSAYYLIEAACKRVRDTIPGLVAIPLYSKLPAALQDRVFAQCPNRRVIFATNIAETSITIDGIVYVIDCGLSFQRVWSPAPRMNQLRIMEISQAAANQRAGRAGRTKPGKCFRLYTEEAFNQMPITNAPGVFTDDFKSMMLCLKYCQFDDVASFDFIDPPNYHCYLGALEDLRNMGFINEQGFITPPEWFYAILRADELGCSSEMVGIAAMASVQTPVFIRPRTFHGIVKTINGSFAHPQLDHITLLGLFRAWVKEYMADRDIEKWCNSPSPTRPCLRPGRYISRCVEVSSPRRQALAKSFFMRLAFRSPRKLATDVYITVQQSAYFDALLHPTSVLVARPEAGNPHPFVVYNSFTTTNKPIISMMTAIDLAWIADLEYFREFPKKKDGTLNQPFLQISLADARKAK